MASLPELVVIQASDAPQHTAHLRKILQKLKTENRISGFTALSPDEDLSSSESDTLNKGDMILILLTKELESKRKQIENRIKALKTAQPGIRVAEILVDHLPYNKEFLTFPSDLRPIRNQEDMDRVWNDILGSLKNMFQVQKPDTHTEKKNKPAKEQKTSGNWSKYSKITGIVFGMILIILVIRGLLNGGAIDDRPAVPVPGLEPVPEESASRPVSTTLTDIPPIPLAEREGVMIFGNYSNRDMDPGCTVTGVSARLVNASGTVEVIEDGVGTNNLHVGIEYAADREMARVEITWEVEHPRNVDCTVR